MDDEDRLHGMVQEPMADAAGEPNGDVGAANDGVTAELATNDKEAVTRMDDDFSEVMDGTMDDEKNDDLHEEVDGVMDDDMDGVMDDDMDGEMDDDMDDEMDVAVDEELDVLLDGEADVEGAAGDEPFVADVTVDTGDAPHVVLTEIAGNVRVVGWDRPAVGVVCRSGAAPSVEIENNVVRVKAGADARVRVPVKASLEADEISGDGAVSAVHGELTVRSAKGDLVLRDVGATTIGTVGGDLSARGLSGALAVDAVGGDVGVRDAGPTQFGVVGGDLKLETVAGDVAVHTAGGDAAVAGVDGAVRLDRVGSSLRLRGVSGDVSATTGSGARLDLTPSEGRTYAVTAGSSVRCRFPADAGLNVSVTSGGGRVRIQGADDAGTALGGIYSGVFGDGSASLHVVSGAAVTLEFGDIETEANGWGDVASGFTTEFTADFGDWAEDVSARLRVHATKLADQVGVRLSHVAETMPDVLEAAGMSAEEAERIASRVQRAAEEATERVAKSTERAAERVERKLARAQQRAERHVAKAESRARMRGAVPRPPRPARPPKRGVSDDERLAILRMLEEGRITADEAERLLAALSGRGD